jgi:hypothetical protein
VYFNFNNDGIPSTVRLGGKNDAAKNGGFVKVDSSKTGMPSRFWTLEI